MSNDHKRPLFAFFVVTLACALFMGGSLRVQGLVDVIAGSPVAPVAAVAAGVTLDALAPTLADPRPADATPADPTVDAAEAEGTAPAPGSRTVAVARTSMAVDDRREPRRRSAAARTADAPTARPAGEATSQVLRTQGSGKSKKSGKTKKSGKSKRSGKVKKAGKAKARKHRARTRR